MNEFDPTQEAPPPPDNPAGPPELQGLDPAALLVGGFDSFEAAAPRRSSWEPPSAEELARLLPQYRIERLLGRGGMGAVYRGVQESLHRPVAIKILPAEMAAGPGFVARFQREARTLATLQHPGIVAVYGFGQTSEGHLYFVMEFVDGTDLAHIIRSTPLSCPQALELTLQICDALQYAHGEGVIHRDIKPANLLVTKDGRAKLCDFGLARPVTEDLTALTISGAVMGTPAYMAPEQREGRADHRSDIYALGVLLYEMLTGKRPEGAFDLPSVRAGADVRLDHVVVKAMQHAPEQRYQDVSGIRAEIAKIRTTPLPEARAVDLAPVKTPKAGNSTIQISIRRDVLAAVAVIAVVASAIFFFAKTGGPPPVASSSAPPAPTAPAADSRARAVAAVPPATPGPADPSLLAATADRPWENSLGMGFVPVPGTNILMCIHETRKRDYAAYAAAAKNVEDTSWRNVSTGGVPVSDGEDHPVVNMAWNDAKAFCAWLSKKEARTYRLPTDAEWSVAVGLGEEPGATFEEKEKHSPPDTYPWGRIWPPPKGAGNFADTASAEKFPSHGIITGYTDGFVTTAPVMNFQPNPLGIYDFAGNVLEWCEDIYNEEEGHVLRSSGWFGYGRNYLRSSCRYHWKVGLSTFEIGFRCVVETRR